MRFKIHFDIFVTFLILQLTICNHSIYGQTAKNNSPTNKKNRFGYVSVYTGYGMLFTHNPQLDLSLSFPYTSSAMGTNLQNFSTIKTKIAPKNFTDFETIHMDLSLRNFFLDCGGGWFAHKNSANQGFSGGILLYFGGGATLPFDFKKGLSKKERRFAIQTSLNWSVNDFQTYIGSINNNGTTINALGIVAAPTYTYVAYHGRQSYKATGTADNLDFAINEEYQFIYPRISITTNPLKYNLHCGISIAYCFPISHTETIGFAQSNNSISNSSGGGGNIGLNDKNLSVLINGNKVNSVPFNLNGVCLTLSIGYNLSYFK